MALPRFHAHQLSVGELRLSGFESDHARKSRRLKQGDPVILFDGRGHESHGTILAIDRNGVRVNAGEVHYTPRRPPALTLAIALPKGPRQDVLIEKCTELGVRAIQPLRTERSVASASPHKREKWQRTMIEAAKQSGNCWIPEILAPLELDDVLEARATFDCRLVAATEPMLSPRIGLDEAMGVDPARVLVLIGPEGGWSDSECHRLASSGVTPVQLGPNVLRIETAAIAVAAVVHARRSTVPASERSATD